MDRNRLLVVEDHADSAVALHRLLGREGYEVTVARTLAEAREFCRDRTFDLLIADLSLPDGDSCELLKEGLCHGIPAIALSGRVAPHDVARALEAGFCRHLAKPIDFTALMDAIDQVRMPVEQ